MKWFGQRFSTLPLGAAPAPHTSRYAAAPAMVAQHTSPTQPHSLTHPHHETVLNIEQTQTQPPLQQRTPAILRARTLCPRS